MLRLRRAGVAALFAATPLVASVAPAAASPAATPHDAPAGVSRADWSRVLQLAPALRQLRFCESGGRYQVATGNGFYGAYQFRLSTWRSLGYRGVPNRATPAVQDTAAARLHDRSRSWRDWGVCGRKAARVGR